MIPITVSLEWARMLCSWNYPQQDSHFVWVQSIGKLWMLLPYSPERENLYQDNFIVRAAPTAEEILRRLPRTIEDPTYEYADGHDRCDPPNPYVSHTLYMSTARNDSQWLVTYDCPAGGFNEFGDTLANAAAAMWCYLREHDLLNDPDGE